jgi:hypothetical protein
MDARALPPQLLLHFFDADALDAHLRDIAAEAAVALR